MDMSDIREKESRIEVKAAAVSNLLNSINYNAFGLTLEGVLGNGSYEEQKQAAYNWMNEHYERPGVKFCVSDIRQSQEWHWKVGRILA